MLTISTNAAEFAARVGKVAPAMDKAAAVAIAKCAKVVEARARKHFVGYSQARAASLGAAGLVRARTGHLRSSLNSSDAKRDGGGWYATVGFRDGVVRAYAKTVEYGATFTPTRARILAIPTEEALKPSGEARYRSPKDIEGGFWRKTLAGDFLGFYDVVGKKLRLLFIGKRRVTAPEIKPLRRSLDGARPQFTGIFQAEEAAAIRRALAGGG